MGHSQGVYRAASLQLRRLPRDLAPALPLTQRVELRLAFSETLSVGRVDKEDNTVNLGEVVAPETTGLHVSTKVIGGETDVADCELLRGGVEGGLESREAVVLEHVKESLGNVSGKQQGSAGECEEGR